jgi:Co/Zn/Cd efflux system component
MSNCDCSIEVESREQGRLLIILLAINSAMFVAELAAGILAESTGLVADSLDMLGDAAVYGIGLYAVGRALSVKIHAAFASGYLQIALALVVAFDIGRRAVLGSYPEPAFMIVISMAALVANVVCLVLLSKHGDGEVHMRASWIFSKNDVIANVGVILSGLLVEVLGSRWPDLIVGLLIVAVVFRGGLIIVADARRERARSVKA